jgi:hypothetical protein
MPPILIAAGTRFSANIKEWNHEIPGVDHECPGWRSAQ